MDWPARRWLPTESPLGALNVDAKPERADRSDPRRRVQRKSVINVVIFLFIVFFSLVFGLIVNYLIHTMVDPKLFGYKTWGKSMWG